MLRVRLLGRMEVEAGGTLVTPPHSRRAWSLLAWLAVHPGVHPRSAVAAQFWPDVLESSARASLRSAVWTLRLALGPAGSPALLTGRDRIELRCVTDLAAFDGLVAAGELERAIALCRGPLLADLDDDWVLVARDEHADRQAAVLAALAAAADTPVEAVAWARRRLAVNPLDEEAARDLMRRLAAAGEPAAALIVCERLRARLRRALGGAPSEQTRALAERLRRAAAVPT